MSTTENALETYKRTVRDEDRSVWPTWVIVVSNSLAAGEWIGGNRFEPYAEEVFNILKAEQKISYSDSN